MSSPGSSLALEDAFKDIRPFVRTRQEVIEARQRINAFLSSYHNSRGTAIEPALFLTHPLPRNGLELAPDALHPEGESRYLEALQNYLKARARYSKVAEELATKSESLSRAASLPIKSSSIRSFEAKLAVLKQQKRYQRLQVLTDYHGALCNKEAASPDYLSLESLEQDMPRHQPSQVNKASRESLHDDDGSQKQRHISRTSQLEKELLEKKSLADRELQALRILQTKISPNQRTELFNISNSSKLRALERCRSELVAWIEEELARPKARADQSTEPSNTSADHDALLSEAFENVQNLYREYCLGKKQQIHAARFAPVKESTESEVCDSGPTPQKTKPSQKIQILAYEQLVTSAQLHRSVIAQKSYAGTMMSKQQHLSLQNIGQLVEQSDTLRLSGSTSSSSRGAFQAKQYSRSGEESLEIVKAWAIAAQNRHESQKEKAASQIMSGKDKLMEIHQAGGLLADILGTKWGSESGEAESTTHPTDHQVSSDPGAKHSSIWEQLDGQMGAIGDGV